MSGHWSIVDLLRSVARRGAHPAVVMSQETGVVVWSSATLAREAETLARGLLQAGLRRMQPVALWAPNSPDWIIAALAIMAAGGVLVAVDDLFDPAQVAAALDASSARMIFATAHNLAAAEELLHANGITTIQVDAPNDPGSGRVGWPAPDLGASSALPEPATDDPAIFGWTSGTTGPPRGFLLSYGNIGSNVEALYGLHIVGPRDRVLQPLPLHHAYPFVVGTLTALAVGATIVLPAGTTGPLIMRALRDGDVTVIIGVPRLYDAMLATMRARVARNGRAAHALWRLLLRVAVWMQQRTGLNPGRLWFSTVRRNVAPHLRYLVSGGARLDREAEQQLDALGWTVLVGYGLAETASLFTGNPPQQRRVGSAGKPLAAGEIRISRPDIDGIGEIELRGPTVTAGYVNDPEANETSFTEDGWFRTGDMGFVDRDGFLYVTGRSKEILVLGSGKKLNPEELERIYRSRPQIHEIAVLEQQGGLVALVRPNAERVRDMGTTNLRDGIRIALAEAVRDLPAYQHLSGFALTDEPLPRTRLGKYRRFLLPALYRQALAGARRAPHPLKPGDQDLLRDSTADAVWAVLQERYPGRAVDLDATLALDLNLDSFGWMELGIALEERCGVHLTETDIATIDTIRDLLRRCTALRMQGPASTAPVAVANRYLAHTGMFLTLLGFIFYAINWIVMRLLFRLRVRGVDNLPAAGGFVITPNHASFLDPLAIAASLPLSRARSTYWAGTVTLLFSSGLRRMFSRAAHVFPVDESRPDAAIDTGVQVLKAGRITVWFPEGWRSPDGTLQRFLPGIGRVVLRAGVVVVPTCIAGAFNAWPRGRWLPKPARITVTFGYPELVNDLRASGSGATNDERVAQALQQRVLVLGSGTLGAVHLLGAA